MRNPVGDRNQVRSTFVPPTRAACPSYLYRRSRRWRIRISDAASRRISVPFATYATTFRRFRSFIFIDNDLPSPLPTNPRPNPLPCSTTLQFRP